MKYLFSFVFILCVVPASAQLLRWAAGPGQLDLGKAAGSGYVDLGKKVSVLVDPGGRLTIDSVSSPAAAARFQRSGQSILHFGFTDAYVWLRFTLDNPTSDSLLLELDHAFLPTADLYYRDGAADPDAPDRQAAAHPDVPDRQAAAHPDIPDRQASPHWAVQRAGFRVPLNKKPVVNAAQVFPLPPGLHTFYLRMKPWVHAIPVALWEKSHYQLKASREKIYYGVYTGLLLFAIAINLFLFYTFRRRYYLTYSILVALYILSSALVMEGYAVYFFPTIDLMFWYRLVPVLDMPALLLYCLGFLEVRRYTPRLYRVCTLFSFALLAYAAVLEFLPQLPVLVINQGLALAVFLLAILLGVQTGRKGNKLGYYFVVAYSIWFVLINLELVYIQAGWPPHIGPISYVSSAMFIEAFLLAWLLVQRFRWEKQEDQRRQVLMQGHINKMHREFEHAIFSSKLEIQEQTFQEISQEIHDNIGQILSLAKLHIATMEAGGDNALATKIREAKSLVTKAISDLRSLSHRLNTGYINEVGFDTAVKREMDTIRRTGAFETQFTITGHLRRFDGQKELILFRIVQELLNNIIKHAGARTIVVALTYDEDALQVAIRDDGRGFDLGSFDGPLTNGHRSGEAPPTNGHDSANAPGLGLKSMHHRAGLIGAEFHLTSHIGMGTAATVRLPLKTTTALAPAGPEKNSTL